MHRLPGAVGPGTTVSPRTIPLWTCAALLFCASLFSAVGGALASGRGAQPANSPVDLAALQDAFAEVVDHASPSVVGIRARRHHVTTVSSARPAGATGTAEQVVVINGSGTVIRADGSILTNEHVIRGAWEIEVALPDHTTTPATVVAADPRSDLAILRVNAAGLVPVQMCDWSAVRRGQWSLALGNPYGLGADGNLSVSVGVIANLDRHLPGLGEVDDRLYADMIQTTAAVHPGNSGGPLLGIRGELIGVVTAVHARGVDDEGVGFAIPMTPAKRRIIARLLDGEAIEHGFLGLTVRTPQPPDYHAAGLGTAVGVFVEKIEPDGPAAKAGITVGDIITSFAGRSVDAPMQLAALVGQTTVGQRVDIQLQRGTQPLAVRAVVEPRQIDRVDWMRGSAFLWRGVRLTDLTPTSRARMNIPPQAMGVLVIGVVAGSSAERAQIRIGDVIEHIDAKAVAGAAAFMQRVRSTRGAVQLGIRDRGNVTVRP